MVEWCTPTNGVEIEALTVLKNLLDALYNACDKFLYTITLMGKIVGLLLPSGVAIVIYDGQLKDFRISSPRYWALRITLFGLEDMPIICPLPHVTLKDLWSALCARYDVGIPNSETWLYKDGEVWKQGIEFSPQKQYMIMEDGGPDAVHMAFIMAIFYGLYKLGLFKIASTFITSCMAYVKNKRMTDMMDQIYDAIEDQPEPYVFPAELEADIKDMADKIHMRWILK